MQLSRNFLGLFFLGFFHVLEVCLLHSDFGLVLQSFEDAGFAEDHRLSNLKLFLGALACTFALVAQVPYTYCLVIFTHSCYVPM